jgi:exonuclease SbcD
VRLLHTADWHLGDRLGRIDRTADLRIAVERVARYCETERIDVLVVAGDLFSELARPDTLRETIAHWQTTFGPFLARGGTVLAITGNHDNETFCQTLRHAMALAAPLPEELGAVVPLGRFYLAAEPTLLRIKDPAGFDVWFALLPWPTASRYLAGELGQSYRDPGEKNRKLVEAFDRTLKDYQRRIPKGAPAVLSAHITVRGADIGAGLFRLDSTDDLAVEGNDLAERFAYVALGHIHKPQSLSGHSHVRYSGSIERMDLGEQRDAKGVVVFELGPAGRTAEPVVLPLESTPIYDVQVINPAADLPRLREEYSDAGNDLANLHVRYTAGLDDLEDVLRDLDRLFPRWYARDWTESGKLGPSFVVGEPDREKGFAETVREYLKQELVQHGDEETAAILERAETLMQESP